MQRYKQATGRRFDYIFFKPRPLQGFRRWAFFCHVAERERAHEMRRRTGRTPPDFGWLVPYRGDIGRALP